MNYHTISLDLAEHSYDIKIAYGLRRQLSEHLKQWNKGQTWVLLTQQVIVDLYPSVIESLTAQGFKLTVIIVPGDESAKSIEQAERVWNQMIKAGCDRSSKLLVLGGGVVGDLGGFVAATFMRGIAYVQIPTTLLAMIDSAIGGKTGVNLPSGKNLVGAIHQPSAVLIDPGFLKSLPRRNVISSLGEAIKYGFIRDKSIFDTINSRFDDLLGLKDESLLSEIIVKSCSIKSTIVANDQFENGERKLLNYGHTIGHAFEAIEEYAGLYHGEAILYGMRCANAISFNKGLLNDHQYRQAQALLQRFPLPDLGKVSPDKVLEVISHDKKNINGTLSFILIDKIGNAVVRTDVSDDDIVDSLAVVS